MNLDYNLPIPYDINRDIGGNEISFEGNTNLKKAGTIISYSQDHMEEWNKCRLDWRYFSERHYHILSLDEGIQKVKLRDYQVDMVNNFINNRFNIVLAARQIGKSTSVEIFICWYILFSQDKNVAILANKAEQSEELLGKIKQAYELLPKWLQQGVKTWNQKTIVFENGCKVMARATSSSGIRGKSISLLVIDELAFIPKNIFDNFYSSVYPTISSGKDSKVIGISTANGYNHYFKMWNDAEQGKSKFVPYRVDWWQVPGRDEDWKEETIANIGKVRFATEYGNDFQGSSDTLVEAAHLSKLKYSDGILITDLSEYKLTDKVVECLNINTMPEPDHIYALGVDTSRINANSHGDAFCIQILDITSIPYKQVAVFRINTGISYLETPQIIIALAKMYNEGYVFIENNDIGQEVANIVYMDFEYENTYCAKPGIPGFNTNKKTKAFGLNNLKLLIEGNKLELFDFNTISELSTMVKYKNTYKAEAGYNDDCVMSLVAAIYFLQDKQFEKITDLANVKMQNIFNIMKEETDDDFMPVGFIIDDGVRDDSWLLALPTQEIINRSDPDRVW